MNLRKNIILLIVFIFSYFMVESKGQHIPSFRNETKVIKLETSTVRNNNKANSYEGYGAVTRTCTPDNVYKVSGSYLRLSNIPSKKRRQCSPPEWGQETKIVELLALEKVYIDQDFTAVGEELVLVIVAPVWEVVGARKIVLDGADGEAMPKAENGTTTGNSSGAHGKSGLSGSHGGTFFGIGGAFINGMNLTVSLNGGRGGPGQDGGDGADGIDGHTYDIAEGLEGLRNPMYNVSQAEEPDLYFFTEKIYTIQGPKGTAGGRGGDGGVGGKGGRRGEKKLIDVDIYNHRLKNPIKFSALDGLRGTAGLGGRGGKGGSNAKTVVISDEFRFFSPDLRKESETESGAASNGADGEPGRSPLKSKTPHKNHTIFQFENAKKDFELYVKKYYSHTHSRSDNRRLRKFTNLLETYDDTIQWYEDMGRLDELSNG